MSTIDIASDDGILNRRADSPLIESYLNGLGFFLLKYTETLTLPLPEPPSSEATTLDIIIHEFMNNLSHRFVYSNRFYNNFGPIWTISSNNS